MVDAMTRARKYLEKFPGAVSGSGGHKQTFKTLASLWYNFGNEITEDHFRILANDYNQRCQPAWSQKELEHKISDVLKNVKPKPAPNNSTRAYNPPATIQAATPNIKETPKNKNFWKTQEEALAAYNNLPIARDDPEVLEFLKRDYGLDEEFIPYTWRVMDYYGERGIVYAGYDPARKSLVFRWKSIARDANGKRKCRFLWGKGGIAFYDNPEKPDAPLVIVGGEEKAAAAYMAGYRALTLLTGEHKLDDAKIKHILDKKPSSIILANDNDKTGANTNKQTAAAFVEAGFPPENIKIVQWHDEAPNGHDLNDVLKDKGIDGLREFLDNSKEYKPDTKRIIFPPDLQTDLNDDADAKRFVFMYGDIFRYCKIWSKWLIYNGQRWQIDRKDVVIEYIKKSLYAFDEYTSHSAASDKWKAEVKRYVGGKLRKAPIQSIEFMARVFAPIAIEPEAFDKNPWLLNVQNGTVDLKTGKLMAHDRSHYITQICPVKYNPNADCPKWREFLNLITGENDDLTKFLKRVCGYCLTGDVGEQKLFYLWGTGANGKSTFLKVIQTILGDYAVKTSDELFVMKQPGTHQTEKMSLKGKRMAVAIEQPCERRLNESLIKEMTGGDTITGRKMYQDESSFEPTHKIFIAANHKIVIHDTTLGFWRRICLIPFTVSIPEDKRIKNYHDILLMEESEGILQWAIEGFLEWKQIGLREPDCVKAATNEYKQDSDILEDFINDCCEIGQGETATNPELYAKYKEWCDENQQKPISQKTITSKLMERGLTRERHGSKGRLWKGISIKVSDTL
ncbi:MAG TPA: phage/plasmid primase, P4 family [Candidatus Sumerlaeia bacterium]|nr:MAG: hypothetical protein BWY12_01740 [candidate division BRC1 bacterium ADurb.Bin183]HRR32386.1 phage/plasmid primase, P4 family [Candidatus Sumerlaeia bacterium]